MNSPEDFQRLQDTLDHIVLTYSRLDSHTVFNYTLFGSSLNKVCSFKDLGVVMSHDLNPWNHISRKCSKANSLMGFLCRTSKDFQSPTTLTTLFKTLVRPILEFSSVVWCPYLTGHIDTLERVQIRFLRLIGLRLGYQFLETPVDCLRISLGLPHLATRRRMADILIFHKMVNGALDCPRLLSLPEFRIPTSTRSEDIFFKRALPSL
ncbi:uncharacterized protein LOC124354586 [Homalodisca vitripennis]|uniref:uncharacterized protein LOC124354586 n=1 Tax=Homalodisca vitripennis TaxID=197043 RepID=UPI001EEA05FF|nr:uncharacterized protein LOC124354586 [Homalodisca vitripennis]